MKTHITQSSHTINEGMMDIPVLETLILQQEEITTVDLNCVNHRSRNSGTLPTWIACDFREDEQ